MLSKPEHPPLTTDALAAWLRTQPPEGTYTWSDPVFCLLGHYLADNQSQWGSAQYSDLPQYELIAKSEPHTFGAALKRTEALLALPAGAPEPSLLELTAEPVPVAELTLPAP
jgi:hypothetical protein